ASRSGSTDTAARPERGQRFGLPGAPSAPSPSGKVGRARSTGSRSVLRLAGRAEPVGEQVIEGGAGFAAVLRAPLGVLARRVPADQRAERGLQLGHRVLRAGLAVAGRGAQ